MRSRIWILSTLALPLFATASVPSGAARKEFLALTVRADSGCAQRFTIESTGFGIFGPRGRAPSRPVQAGDTINIAGTGTLKLSSSEPGKALSVDVWMVARNGGDAVRYRGATIKVERGTFTTPYRVTTP